MVFISAILAMMLFATMGLSMVTVVSTNLSGVNEDQTSAQAFHVAEGGMQYILQNRFAGDSDFSDNASPTGAPFGGTPINLNPGQFWVEYLNQTGSSVDVRVTGRVGSAVRVISQSVGQDGGGVDYATMANGNLNFIDSTGNISGDLALRGVANIDPDIVLNGDIIDDPDLIVPTVDLNQYEAMCTSTFTGNYTISVNTTANLCVYGNVTINPGITYTGLLYTTGNVNLGGNNITINGSIVTEGNMNGDNLTGLQFTAGVGMPSLVSQGNMNLSNADGVHVTGLMWNSGNTNLDYTDNGVFVGSFLAGGNFNMSNATNLSITFAAEYTAGIPGLSDPGGGSSTGLSLSGWKAY